MLLRLLNRYYIQICTTRIECSDPVAHSILAYEYAHSTRFSPTIRALIPSQIMRFHSSRSRPLGSSLVLGFLSLTRILETFSIGFRQGDCGGQLSTLSRSLSSFLTRDDEANWAQRHQGGGVRGQAYSGIQRFLRGGLRRILQAPGIQDIHPPLGRRTSESRDHILSDSGKTCDSMIRTAYSNRLR